MTVTRVAACHAAPVFLSARKTTDKAIKLIHEALIRARQQLDEAGRAGYRQFLAMPRPRAFVLAPNGAWAYSNAGADPLPTILAECRTKTPDCRPYAVDGAVV